MGHKYVAGIALLPVITRVTPERANTDQPQNPRYDEYQGCRRLSQRP